MGAFLKIADYYEVFSNVDKRISLEGPTLLSYLDSVPNKTVLDVACGTGVHSLFLAQNGARVTAIDLSFDMLKYAKLHRFHENIRYICCDMRNLLKGKWGMAICLGNSLSLIHSQEELLQVLDGVFAVLFEGGVFIIQILNYSAPFMMLPQQKIEKRTHNGKFVIAVKDLIPHEDFTFVSLQFFIKDETWIMLSEWGTLKHWSKDDLCMLGSSVGFIVEQIYGGFDKQPYHQDTASDVVLVLKKPTKIPL